MPPSAPAAGVSAAEALDGGVDAVPAAAGERVGALSASVSAGVACAATAASILSELKPVEAMLARAARAASRAGWAAPCSPPPSPLRAISQLQGDLTV